MLTTRTDRPAGPGVGPRHPAPGRAHRPARRAGAQGPRRGGLRRRPRARAPSPGCASASPPGRGSPTPTGAPSPASRAWPRWRSRRPPRCRPGATRCSCRCSTPRKGEVYAGFYRAVGRRRRRRSVPRRRSPRTRWPPGSQGLGPRRSASARGTPPTPAVLAAGAPAPRRRRPTTPSGDAVGRLAAPRLDGGRLRRPGPLRARAPLRPQERGRGEVPQRDPMTMRVFVTGATGLIGRALASVARRRRPRGGGALPQRRARPGCRPVHGRCKGDPAVAGPWQEELSRCDACVNLAGRAGGRGALDRRAAQAHPRQPGARHPERRRGPRRRGAVGARERQRHRLLRPARRRGGRRDLPGRERLPRARRPGVGGGHPSGREAGPGGARPHRHRPRRRRAGRSPKLVLPFKMLAGGPIGDGGFWQSWIHVADQVGHPPPGPREPARPGPGERHRARPGAQPRPGPGAGARAAPPQPARGPGLRRPRRARRDGRGGARQPAGGAAGRRWRSGTGSAGRRSSRRSATCSARSPADDREAAEARRGGCDRLGGPGRPGGPGGPGDPGRAPALRDGPLRGGPARVPRRRAGGRDRSTDRSFRGCDAAILAVPAPVARELGPEGLGRRLPGRRPLRRLPLGRRACRSSWPA